MQARRLRSQYFVTLIIDPLPAQSIGFVNLSSFSRHLIVSDSLLVSARRLKVRSAERSQLEKISTSSDQRLPPPRDNCFRRFRRVASRQLRCCAGGNHERGFAG